METRKRDTIYLLQHDDSQIVGAKLPSNGQALKVLFYNLRKVKLSLRSSAHLVVKEVEVFWDKARIPTRKFQHCVEKFEALYNEWKVLQKSSKRRTEGQNQKENTFVEKLDDLFDIAHASALEMTNQEDKEFLKNQRKKGRPGSMIGSDRVLLEKEKKYLVRQKQEQLRKQRHEEMQSMNFHAVSSISSSSSEDEQRSIHEEIVVKEPESDSQVMDVTEKPGPSNIQPMELEGKPGPYSPPTRKRKRGTRKFITTKLVAAFDKCKVSDRDAVHILIATAEALHHDVNDLIINRSSIRRCRERLRKEHASKLRQAFDETEISAIAVHWDGKMLPALMQKKLVDRLPVIATYKGVEQLLGVPQLESGTGRDQALAVYNTLQEWNLADKVQALCCDTTASNTGRIKGACILLEQELGRDVLYLPCRHHIYELILRSVFDTKLAEKSTGPNVELFKRFQKSWSTINLQNFKTGMEDQSVEEKLSVFAEDTKQFALQNVQKHHPREDYKELLELTIIFLGGVPPRGISFRVPGAFHHARWMAKAIYCLKIFLFRTEFILTEEEESGIRDVCVFLASLYVKAWINAPNPIEAPRQDFDFLKNLSEYENDLQIRHVTVAKFCNHLWYLAPESTSLAFFDDNVSQDTKRRMVQALQCSETDMPPSAEIKKFTMLPENVKYHINKGIEQFIQPSSKNFFKRFNIETQFLDKDPLTWKNDDSYNAGLEIVKHLKVVNDSAERGVKLMEDFNNLFTKNENQKQFVLQVVSDYRRKYSDSKKDTLLSKDF